ncbi:Glycosyl Hydrolase Family 88 [Chitinophaga eiseniae]|uniref:Glycosyl Hydrolase Family 88 n=1 Tax=Chitinophaga eiseniae TaxID=634771 RepID=A0A1T4TSK8_9BACT|nr:glycoside hydrolase family 88 protein [Chitinophaga eiseniae]SKA43473.1 Glycosyl Hydrolase Family 88 [Chitinophaga eiseniae]
MKTGKWSWCMLICCTAMSYNGKAQTKNRVMPPAMKQTVDSALSFSVRQYKHMMTALPDDRFPRTTAKDGTLMTAESRWWTSGFYPGTLWYLYEYSKDPQILAEANKRLRLLEKEQYNRQTHDLGFMMYNSYGNALRIAPQAAYRDILLNSARSLASRFNARVNCIRSWDHGNWQFPVIIDNMMNLELLTWATRQTGDSTYYNIAVNHANTTLLHHFRKDFSTWHVIDYDTLTGKPVAKKTFQGAADSSAWARGQTWALYGYTMMYRETRNPRYLQQAVAVATFLLHHPALPKDKIPYWDFNAADIPYAYRDASAATVMASALLELSTLTKGKQSDTYWKTAEQIIVVLSSDTYRAKEGENNNFILMKSVGSLPHGVEINVPLSYADYYFVEALMRYRQYTRH